MVHRGYCCNIADDAVLSLLHCNIVASWLSALKVLLQLAGEMRARAMSVPCACCQASPEHAPAAQRSVSLTAQEARPTESQKQRRPGVAGLDGWPPKHAKYIRFVRRGGSGCDWTMLVYCQKPGLLEQPPKRGERMELFPWIRMKTRPARPKCVCGMQWAFASELVKVVCYTNERDVQGHT